MRAPKGFVVQKVSDYGTGNRNIARVFFQVVELTKITKLDLKQREELFHAANELSLRLANAESAVLDLKKRSEGIYNELKAQFEQAGDEHGREIPYVPALQLLFEGFFYNAKNILRDLGGVPMKILFGKRFDEASQWCSFKEGKESEISKYLRRKEQDHPGHSTVRELVERFRPDLQTIVTIRNALEHPGKAAGTVRVVNWRAVENGLRPPTYSFEADGKEYDLIDTLVAMHEILLNLTETVLVFGLMFYVPEGFGFQHIPEEDRDQAAPVAFRLVPLPPNAFEQSKPFTGRVEEA